MLHGKDQSKDSKTRLHVVSDGNRWIEGTRSYQFFSGCTEGRIPTHPPLPPEFFFFFSQLWCLVVTLLYFFVTPFVIYWDCSKRKQKTNSFQLLLYCIWCPLLCKCSNKVVVWMSFKMDWHANFLNAEYDDVDKNMIFCTGQFLWGMMSCGYMWCVCVWYMWCVCVCLCVVHVMSYLWCQCVVEDLNQTGGGFLHTPPSPHHKWMEQSWYICKSWMEQSHFNEFMMDLFINKLCIDHH